MITVHYCRFLTCISTGIKALWSSVDQSICRQAFSLSRTPASFLVPCCLFLRVSNSLLSVPSKSSSEMPSQSKIARIESQILDQMVFHHECWVCLEPMRAGPLRFDKKHAMVPCRFWRGETCGHTLHYDCVEKLVGTTSGYWDEGGLFIRCGMCRTPATVFCSANLLLSKPNFSLCLFHFMSMLIKEVLQW